MKLPRLAAGLVMLIVIATAASARAAITAGGAVERVTAKEITQGFRDRAFLAKPRAGLDSAELAAAETGEALRVIETLPRLGGLRVIENSTGEDVDRAIARLRATGRYEFVEPDYVVRALASPSDPAYTDGTLWAFLNTGQNGGLAGADIRAPEAWDLQTSAANIVVAVIDSGLRVTHQELTGNLWVNTGEIAGNGIDDDADGYIDNVHGINAINRTGNPADEGDHGTGVASVIGAVPNNGVGLAGVAWNVQLMGLRFIDATGNGFLSDELRCINFAVARRVHVINASFGGSNYSQAAYDALRQARDAGIIVVCAAGNDTENNDSGFHFPSSYLLDNIVSVAATTRADVLATYSNFGSGMVDLAAPGSAIYLASSVSDSTYDTSSGTSFSAPMVSGAIALLKARYPADTYRQTINRLLRSTRKLTGLSGKVATGGRLDLAAALSIAETRPFNDDFAQRSLLSGEDISARAASQGATNEGGEPAHAGSGNTSLWWTWTPSRSGPVTIDTTDSAFDTLLAVYTGGALGALNPVASNDNEAAGKITSKVSFNAVAGTSYQIAVDGKGGATGLAVLNLLLQAGNDAFTSAQPLTGRSFAVDGSNVTATRETGEPLILGRPGGRSLWYNWVAPATRRYHVSAFATGTADTMLGIYTGTALNSLTLVASSLDYGTGVDLITSAATSFTAVAGTTYRIAVDTDNGTSGAFTLALTDSEWEFNAGDEFYASPTAAPDGTIYLADAFGDVYALNPDGTRKWTYELDGFASYSTPAVGTDGTIYVGDTANFLYAIRPDGSLRWRFQAGGDLPGSPALAADGTIYFRCDDGLLYAVNPDGTRKWTAALPSPESSYTSASVGGDGTIYAGSADGKLYAFAPDGTQKWAFNTGGAIYATPAIAADGTIYVGSFGKSFFAIKPDGTQKWSYVTPDSISGSAAVASDGTVYFGGYDKNLYALTADGTLRWTYPTSDEIRGTSPALASDGTIYMSSLDGLVHVVDPDGTRQRVIATGAELRSSPLLHNGRLYIASFDRRVYVIEVARAAASSAWPMHRQNVRRTGRFVTQPLSLGVQPQPQVVAAGSSVTFSAGAIGTPPFTYQWRKNGAVIAGAAGPSYTIDSVILADAASYSVTVSDPTGSLTSNAATLAVSASTPGSNSRLSAISCRAIVGTGGDVLIPGIIIAGSGQRQVVVRAKGPSIAGVSGTLARPQLKLYEVGVQNPIAENIGWSSGSAANTDTLRNAFTLAGLPLFPDGSADCALLATVDAGKAYTAVISGVSNTTGVALVEVYELGNAAARMSAISCRAQVGTGGDILIPGIIILGSSPKQVIIRAAAPQGVSGSLAKPQLVLNGGAGKLAENTGWSTAGNVAEVSAATAACGLSAFAPGSADCAILVTLPPGGYTAQVSGLNNTTGVALIEVYEVP
ncbi:MAG TPA: PQQ-binding-like beta-propeller repeat protein [Opitutaceae bacterium]|nr:PQQ-binding-like beta-propeller repeat protein [Opitutaceae bacterium]